MKTIKSSPSEKRKHPRTPLGVALEIHLKGQLVDRAQGKILDLSEGGMTFVTDAVMEEGMSFYLRAKALPRIRGEVRSIRAAAAGMHRYGIRFHKIGVGMGDASNN